MGGKSLSEGRTGSLSLESDNERGDTGVSDTGGRLPVERPDTGESETSLCERVGVCSGVTESVELAETEKGVIGC